MKALRFINKQLELQEIDLKPTPENEALIRVVIAGICATDMEIIKGYMDFEGVIGHEFVGIVEECQTNPDLIGKRVVGEINAACGKCVWCMKGLGRHCPDRTTLGIFGRDGAFTEYVHLPVENLHIVPENITNRNAVFVEPLAAAYEILEQINIRTDVPVLLIGDGKLAQLIIRVLARRGCQIHVAGVSERKIERMNGLYSRVYIREFPMPDIYTIVIEASGSPVGWDAAVSTVEPRGTIILKSTFADAFSFNPAPLVIKEVTVIGSRCGTFGKALEALSGGMRVSDLIDAEFTFDDWQEAFKKAHDPETLKVILRMEGI
ncbi:alcohol dehydrogenase catalytic domain-containing protein [bacterium]|nr:alcohol dehydrogenase catalytic domain-containing protein [bacterium]